MSSSLLAAGGPTDWPATALRRLRKGAVAVAASLVPYLRIARLLPQVSLLLTLAVALGVLVGALLPIGFTVAAGLLVGSVPATLRDGIDSPSGGRTLVALAAVGALFVAGRATGLVRGTLAGILGRRLDQHLQERVMRAVNRPLGIAHLEDPAARDLLSQAQGVSGGGYTAGGTVAPIAGAAGSWLQSAGSAALLTHFSAPLALLLFGAWVVAAHFFRREYLRSTQVATNQTKYLRRAGYLRDLVLTPGAAKEIRLWGLVDWLGRRFTEAWLRSMTPQWAERTGGSRVHAVTVVGINGVHFLALAAIGLAAVRGEIDLTALATYVGAATGVGVVNMLGVHSFRLAYGTASVSAVLALEQRAAETAARQVLVGSRLPEAAPPADTPQAGIRFEGVIFRYPGREADALAGLDLLIPAGRSLAIVGANGAGKTTLVKLLCRLYDPDSGRILVDGVDLRDLDARAWQRRIAAIFQDFVQYHLTARDNVAFGALDYVAGVAPAAAHRNMEAAARQAGALEVVEALPRGWDTMLSRQFTGGADLSGGQWQRLALARALFAVHAGARILILDEPTANLDVRAEATLYERFLDITQGLTTIVISHRFSTVRRADRICVVEHGRVVEQGTHDELLVAGGRYAEMFALQASRFVDGADGQRKEHRLVGGPREGTGVA